MLPAINPKIVFKGTGVPTVEVSVPIPVLSKSATLRELFDSLEIFCGKKRKKGVVIFDEFQEIIAIAAEETASIYEKRFIFAHNLGTASSVQKAAAKLFQHDIIRKQPSGRICFVNPFFKQWINQIAVSAYSSPDIV